MGNLFSIPSGKAFVDSLARGLLDETKEDPAALADMLILLPTRRACRSLQEAFLRQTEGAALLLPGMRPLGDVDEEEIILTGSANLSGEGQTILTDLLNIPPAVSETERLLHLSHLVHAFRTLQAEGHDSFDPPGPEQALLLARELARLIDQVQTEGLSFDSLEGLVPETYASHWAETIRFLSIIRDQWPAHLEENGQIDPARRRAELMMSQVAAWQENPPPCPVIAAGTTGSIPATAELIATVLNLPEGRVVLPGLDQDLDEESWSDVLKSESHPQFGLARLLLRLGKTRQDVQLWPDKTDLDPGRSERHRLLSEVFRPANKTEEWAHIDRIGPQAIEGVHWIEAPGPASEAALISQILREVLEVPGRTGALITLDQTLARRVSAQLSRWGLDIDDSAGMPLAQTSAGRFFLLVAQAAAAQFSPVSLLALLKHPLSALGFSPEILKRRVRRLETVCLRGPKPAAGLAGLYAALSDAAGTGKDPGEVVREDLTMLIDCLDRILGPLEATLSEKDADFSHILTIHVTALEALAQTDEEAGADRLWRNEDGEALAEFISDLQPSAPLVGQVWGADYEPVLKTLLLGKKVRSRYGTHPRLSILGPLEARLYHADRMVLAGLNEGSWPPKTPDDPWMSREMRRAFGLPTHERRIGLTAHDFTQACGAPEVFLLRTVKQGGQPTVPARWLERLATVLKRLGLEQILPETNTETARRLAWQATIDSVPARLPVLQKPMPRPPVGARPRRLSATRIETLMRDPYQIYAQYILNLRKLEDLEADPNAADKGMIIHTALDRFSREFQQSLPENALPILLQYGKDAFGQEWLSRPAIKAFWWPRFQRIAAWFIEQEKQRRQQISRTYTEIGGTLVLQTQGGVFHITAEADRIDQLKEGGYAILDYKTGGVPSQSDVRLLKAPQLVLEAAILAEGGFPEIVKGPVLELSYWKLSGGDPAGVIQKIEKIDPDELAREARERLEMLIDFYDDPDTPYTSLPRPDQAPRFNDYAHLARIREWSLGDSEDREEG